MAKAVKTNAMRRLETAGIPYEMRTYTVTDENYDGCIAAEKIGLPPERVFKTLVIKGDRRGYLVCCIPVDRELDLKAAAQAFGDKSAQMLPLKDLLPVTGYVRGGCSPIGMKKAFPTCLDASCLLHETIAVSAGQRGVQMLVDPRRLLEAAGGITAALTRQEKK